MSPIKISPYTPLATVDSTHFSKRVTVSQLVGQVTY